MRHLVKVESHLYPQLDSLMKQTRDHLLQTTEWRSHPITNLDKMASRLHHQLAAPHAAQKGCLHPRAGIDPINHIAYSGAGICPKLLPATPGQTHTHQPHCLLKGKFVLLSHASHCSAGAPSLTAPATPWQVQTPSTVPAAPGQEGIPYITGVGMKCI